MAVRYYTLVATDSTKMRANSEEIISFLARNFILNRELPAKDLFGFLVNYTNYSPEIRTQDANFDPNTLGNLGLSFR